VYIILERIKLYQSKSIFYQISISHTYKMSTSPNGATTAVASTKRPLEDPSSPSAPTDLPDAKRPALDKLAREEETPLNGAQTGIIENVKVDAAPLPASNGTATSSTEVTESAATNGTTAPAADVQPIPTTAQMEQVATQPQDPNATVDETNWIHIRAVISSAEAATCIGKGGENVSQVRKLSGAKCTVSDYSRGQVERILTVSGAQDAVAKVCFFLVSDENQSNMYRLLV
jgi:heterogeneous nuclear rnp K-like protein 2